MTAGGLADLAIEIAPHADWIIGQAPRLSARGLAAYWTASKCRFDLWHRQLGSMRDFGRSPAASRVERFDAIRPLIEEILVSEPLTRQWAAICTAYDRQRSTDEAASLAKSVYLGHLEGRLRALQLIKTAAELGLPAATELDGLRRSAERWTDILLARMAPRHAFPELAFNVERLRLIADELSADTTDDHSRRRWGVLVASMTSGIRRIPDVSPNADQNRAIAVALLSCLSPEIGVGTSLAARVWVARLSHMTDDVNDLIDEALRPDPAILD